MCFFRFAFLTYLGLAAGCASSYQVLPEYDRSAIAAQLPDLDGDALVALQLSSLMPSDLTGVSPTRSGRPCASPTVALARVFVELGAERLGEIVEYRYRNNSNVDTTPLFYNKKREVVAVFRRIEAGEYVVIGANCPDGGGESMTVSYGAVLSPLVAGAGLAGEEETRAAQRALARLPRVSLAPGEIAVLGKLRMVLYTSIYALMPKISFDGPLPLEFAVTIDAGSRKLFERAKRQYPELGQFMVFREFYYSDPSAPIEAVLVPLARTPGWSGAH